MTAVSPNGRIEVEIDVVDGLAQYTVRFDDDEVITPSRLGLVTAEEDLGSGLSVESVGDSVSISDEFSLPHGKARHSTATGNERVVTLRNVEGRLFEVAIRAYDDGVAFQYRAEFPEPVEVADELTQFSVGSEGRGFLSAYQTATDFAPAYERPYAEVPIGHGAPVPGWVFPALFEADGTWMLITESGLDETYAATHLGPNPIDGTYELDFPLVNEGLSVGSWLPTVSRTWESPWRVILIGDSPAAIFESNLVRHLAGPTELDVSTWAIPGRVSWSWWSDHDSPQNPVALKEHIDLAAEMGWEYSLIDANWNLMPEGTIEDLVAHGAERGVGLFLWYNSGGPHNNVTEQPRDRMHESSVRRAEFDWLASLGIKGIKVDFFHRDNQEGMALYLGIIGDAADSKIMVNFHGSTIPRGWDRRFPHMMTMEGVWGAEQYGFDPTFSELASSHNTMLAMTRNVPGSMDYTPVTLSDSAFAHTTSNAHELALAVVFESSLQHFADSAASYRSQPDAVREFLMAVPSVWDESLLLDGEPGDYLVVARRLDNAWFIGAINGTGEDRVVEVDLERFGGEVSVISDGSESRAYNIETVSDSTTSLTMAPHGGFVMMNARTGGPRRTAPER